MKNWSENVDFGPARFHQPVSLAELQRIVSASTDARVVGAGHSFNEICQVPNGDLISLAGMDDAFDVDRGTNTVRFSAGYTHEDLTERLAAEGLGLHNLPSLPNFNVAGACATGTHGSGDTNPCLAAAITSLTMVTAEGDLVDVPSEHLPAIAVGLGAFGVITHVEMEVQASYDMAQELYLDLPVDVAIAQVDELMASAYSVSYFTDWQSDVVEQVWRKHRLGEGGVPQTPDSLLGATRATEHLAPSGSSDPEGAITEQGLRPGPWHLRLPHVRPGAALRPTQLQSEYFVDRRDGPAALEAARQVAHELAPVLRDGVKSEIRSVASDELWLSPFDTDSLALHFSWINDPTRVAELLPILEEALQPFQPKPHWGKLYQLAPSDVRSRYRNFDSWARLVDHYDPGGTFRNPHLRRLLD